MIGANPHINGYRRQGMPRTERSAFSVTAVQEMVGEFMGTFQEFPPRQKPAKFNVGDVMKKMYEAGSN